MEPSHRAVSEEREVGGGPGVPTEPSSTSGPSFAPVEPCLPPHPFMCSLGPSALQPWPPRLEHELTLRGCLLGSPTVPCTQQACSVRGPLSPQEGWQ